MGGEGFARLRVGEVQPAAAGDEEFATDGRLGVVERDGRASARSDFRCAESRGAAADDRDVHARIEAEHWHEPQAGRVAMRVFL